MDMTASASRVFLKNVLRLTESRGKRGSLERECGVITGYLSRAAKTETSGISLQTAAKMAKALGYPLDDLIDPNFERKRHIAEINRKIDALQTEKETYLNA